MKKVAGLVALAVALGLAGRMSPGAPAAGVAFTVNDQTATESLEHWNNHYVPSLALSEDVKVGKHSICGTYGFTENAILWPGDNLYWDLTKCEKMVFWVKSDQPNDNLRVMLLTNGFDHRRDAVASIGKEWKLIELPFTEETFEHAVGTEFSFAKVAAVDFYQNQTGQYKIWIDGLEFVQGTPKQPARTEAAPQGK